MNQQQRHTEAIIMMALFKCTVEHSTHLIGTMKQKQKQDFTVWQNQGFKMLEHFEKEIPDFAQHIETVTDAIHSIISESKELAENGVH